MIAFVLKSNDPFAVPTFSRLSNAAAMEKATFELLAGAYRMIAQIHADDSEAVFDAVNMECNETGHTPPMNPGDVILWEDGRRELCLNQGWAII